MVILFIKLQYQYFIWWLQGRLSNKAVKYYMLLSPTKPVEDSLRAIVLEQLLFIHRKLEVKRYGHWLKVIEHSNNMGVVTYGNSFIQKGTVPDLETEDILAQKVSDAANKS